MSARHLCRVLIGGASSSRSGDLCSSPSLFWCPVNSMARLTRLSATDLQKNEWTLHGHTEGWTWHDILHTYITHSRADAHVTNAEGNDWKPVSQKKSFVFHYHRKKDKRAGRLCTLARNTPFLSYASLLLMGFYAIYLSTSHILRCEILRRRPKMEFQVQRSMHM